MNKNVISVAIFSMALMIGSLAMANSHQDDNIRGAEWDPDRAISQNLPSPQYRSFDDHNRYGESRKGYDHTGYYDNNHEDRRRYTRTQERDDRNNDLDRARQNRMAHTVLGTLLRRQGDYYILNSNQGNRLRLHVDDRTLLDAGIERGDRVIAKMKSNGHAIALRKDRRQRGGPYTH